MEEIEKAIEKSFAIGIQVGVINLATQLGLIDDFITEPQACKICGGKKRVEEFRHKRWIVGYPTGNKVRSTVKFKRSECETAIRMLDMVNVIPASRINQIMQLNIKSHSNYENSKNHKAIPAKL